MNEYIELTLNQYIAESEGRIRRGLPPHDPQTAEQRDWLVDNYPEFAIQFLPPVSEMKHIGKPKTFGRCLAVSEEWRERFLFTLIDDDEFTSAVRVALGLGGRA